VGIVLAQLFVQQYDGPVEILVRLDARLRLVTQTKVVQGRPQKKKCVQKRGVIEEPFETLRLGGREIDAVLQRG